MDIYRLKEKYCKNEDEKWNKVSEEAGEDGVSSFERRTTTSFEARAKEIKEVYREVCGLPTSELPAQWPLLSL